MFKSCVKSNKSNFSKASTQGSHSSRRAQFVDGRPRISIPEELQTVILGETCLASQTQAGLSNAWRHIILKLIMALISTVYLTQANQWLI